MRLVTAVLVLAVLTACRVGQPEFVALIEEATELDAAADRPLRLDQVTPFEWETVHVFGPGTPSDVIVDALGFRWRDGDVEGPEGEDQQLIVFVEDDAVVGAAVMDRCRPDFVGADGLAGGLRPGEAVFRLDATGQCWQAQVAERSQP